MVGELNLLEHTKRLTTSDAPDPTGSKLHADSYHGIGITPTFARPRPACEPQVIEFHGDLYPDRYMINHDVDPKFALNTISRDRNAITDDSPVAPVITDSKGCPIDVRILDQNGLHGGSADIPSRLQNLEDPANPISQNRNAITDGTPGTPASAESQQNTVNPISRDRNAIQPSTTTSPEPK